MNNSSDQTQLILSGSIAIDRIMNFDGRYKDLIQADKLHVLSLSVLLDKLEQTRGGVAANIAHNLARLGEHPILLGAVGRDAELYISELTEIGVDTEFVHYSELATASFNVMTDMDGNQVGGFYPGAMSDSSSLGLDKWAGQDVLACISAHDPVAMRSQSEQCKDLKIRMLYDPGQQVSNVSGDDLAIGVNAAEILTVNDYELGVLSEKTGLSPENIKSNVPIVITTFGSKGSVIEGRDVTVPITIGIAQPTQVVDPTGAGDAFRAGFLYGYLRQWNLQTCGQLGAVLASFVIERHGTQQPLNIRQIEDRYKGNFNESVEL